MNLQEMFEKRKLSVENARQIAESQTDLGGISKADMIAALSSPSNKLRENSYNDLDKISQFIVKTILTAFDYDTAATDLSYQASCLQKAVIAISKIEQR
jgi:hypothetical protein